VIIIAFIIQVEYTDKTNQDHKSINSINYKIDSSQYREGLMIHDESSENTENTIARLLASMWGVTLVKLQDDKICKYKLVLRSTGNVSCNV
jgi:hypothetical protein